MSKDEKLASCARSSLLRSETGAGVTHRYPSPVLYGLDPPSPPGGGFFLNVSQCPPPAPALKGGLASQTRVIKARKIQLAT